MESMISVFAPLVSMIVAASPVLSTIIVLMAIAIYLLLKERSSMQRSLKDRDDTIKVTINQSISIVDSLHQRSGDYADNLTRLTDSLQRLMQTIIAR